MQNGWLPLALCRLYMSGCARVPRAPDDHVDRLAPGSARFDLLGEAVHESLPERTGFSLQRKPSTKESEAQ